MTDHPMLFSAAMVRALLEGRKSQTRRILKPQPGGFLPNGGGWYRPHPDRPRHWQYAAGRSDTRIYGYMDIPYAPGDRIWVRETWADVNSERGPSLLYRADNHLVGWEEFSTVFGEDYGVGPSMNYDAYPGSYTMWWSDLLDGAPDHGWKSPIHMPRWASRLTLTITEVRIQRLQEISEKDAIAEGWPKPEDRAKTGVAEIRDAYPISWYGALWNRLNAKRGAPWASNPWVVALTFTVEHRPKGHPDDR